MSTEDRLVQLPKPCVRETMYGPLYSFACATCGSFVSDERPNVDFAATSARKRGARLTKAGFVHATCKTPRPQRVPR